MCFATTIDEDIDDDISNDIAQNVGLWTKLLSTMMVFLIFNIHSSIFTLGSYVVNIVQNDQSIGFPRVLLLCFNDRICSISGSSTQASKFILKKDILVS